MIIQDIGHAPVSQSITKVGTFKQTKELNNLVKAVHQNLFDLFCPKLYKCHQFFFFGQLIPRISKSLSKFKQDVYVTRAAKKTSLMAANQRPFRIEPSVLISLM